VVDIRKKRYHHIGVMGNEEHMTSFQGKLTKTLHLGQAGAILGCGISYDDETVASCATDNKVLLWDVNTGQCQGSLDGHASDVTRCSFGKEILATGSRDGTVILWRYADNKRCSKITVHSTEITSCTISPNHKYLLTTSADTHCRVWTIRGGNGEFIQGPKFIELFHEGEKYKFSDASFSSDSCAIVTSSTDGQVKLWDSENGQKLLDLCSDEGEILSARFSSDGKYLITMVKKCVKIWNIAKKKVSWSIEDAKGFQALASHPTENMFILIAQDGSISGYDITHKQELFKRSTDHRGPVLSCNFSPSGNLACTGGIDGKLLVWL